MKRTFLFFGCLVASICAADITSVITQPAGSNGEIQINKGGRFGADSGLSYSTTTSVLSAPSINTGQGANELYPMDQDVRSTSSPSFAAITASSISASYVTSAIGFESNVAIAGPRPWVDVTAPPYNADPTGTNYCNTAVDAAITAMTPYDNVLFYFPPGTYKFNDTPLFNAAPHNGWTIMGAGRNTTTLMFYHATSNPYGLAFSGSQNITIRDLTIDGNNMVYDQAARGAINFQPGSVYGVTLGLIENVSILNWKGCGFVLNTCERVTVRNCFIYRCHEHSFYLAGTKNDGQNQIINNVIKENGYGEAGGRFAMKVSDFFQSLIQGNQIIDSIYASVQFQGTDGNWRTDFKNNIILDGSTDGSAQVNFALGTKLGSFNENTLIDTAGTRTGISFSTNAYITSFQGNTFDGQLTKMSGLPVTTVASYQSPTEAVSFDRRAEDGKVLSIKKGGTEVGYIGTATSWIPSLLLSLTGSKVLVSSASGAVSESAVSTTTLSYLDATSSVQTQINTKAPSASPTLTGTPVIEGTNLVTNTADGNLDLRVTDNYGVDIGPQIMFKAKVDAVPNYGYQASVAGRKENATSGDYSGYLQFATSLSNGTMTEKMRISSTGTFTMPGVYSQTSGSAANVFVGTDGQLFRSTSSKRYKTSIKNYTEGLSKVMGLRPVTFHGKNDPANSRHVGLIAEEVYALGLKEFVVLDPDGKPDALEYANMVALLVNSIKELSAKNASLEKRISVLEKKN